MKRIVVLGSTGSIGTQTLDVVRRHADKLEVVVTFLAVLELCRSKAIRLAGSTTDCTVTPEENPPENLTL